MGCWSNEATHSRPTPGALHLLCHPTRPRQRRLPIVSKSLHAGGVVVHSSTYETKFVRGGRNRKDEGKILRTSLPHMDLPATGLISRKSRIFLSAAWQKRFEPIGNRFFRTPERKIITPMMQADIYGKLLRNEEVVSFLLDGSMNSTFDTHCIAGLVSGDSLPVRQQTHDAVCHAQQSVGPIAMARRENGPSIRAVRSLKALQMNTSPRVFQSSTDQSASNHSKV